jgi:ABC-type lipoprotein export system ATPase subunit
VDGKPRIVEQTYLGTAADLAAAMAGATRVPARTKHLTLEHPKDAGTLEQAPVQVQITRVAIARALVGRPAIVLADEPTGNLDSKTGAAIIELLHELNADGATILMITHDSGLAAQMSRQLHVLDGQIVADSAARSMEGV